MKRAKEAADIWDLHINPEDIPDGYEPMKTIGFDRQEFERLKAERADVFLIPKEENKRLRIIIDYDPQARHVLARYFKAL